MKLLQTILLIFLTYLTYSQAQYRLPTNIVPYHYEVHFNLTSEVFTNAPSDTYSGYVNIYFTVTEDTNVIKLHSSHNFVNISEIVVDSNVLTPDKYQVDARNDILTITLSYTLTASHDTRHMSIGFASRLSLTDLYGFYKSSYVDSDNVTRFLVTTQFQATYARRAFPCFDEPAFKATFDIFVTYPHELTALGNTPGELLPSDGWSDADSTLPTIQFQTTPIMSTYLIAVIVSNFTCTSGEYIEKNGMEPIIPYRVCSQPDTSSTREWAVEIGPQLLRDLSTWTGINYSEHGIDKMDQVAIPDLAAGAMENWGLVTYREESLLWDANHSTNAAKESIAAVIAHEFAHMWFGNLVTMKWWSETFLNEGFARYWQYFTIQNVLPDWEMDKRFVTNVLQVALLSDSFASSRALQSEANSDAEVSAKFDTITYSKGASVLRMVEHIMGSDNFKSGVQEYLNTYRFGNTEPEHLWGILNNHTDSSANLPANLTTVMNNWVKNNGFPIVAVLRVGNRIVLVQENIVYSENVFPDWYIPITYTLSSEGGNFSDTTPKMWLTPVGFIEITDLPSSFSWIIVNNLQTGFYRVRYDDGLWTSISNALLNSTNFSGIPEITRAQIVDDAFNLARMVKLDYSQVFEIIRFLANEVEYAPWTAALNGWSFLLRRFRYDSDLGKAMSSHILELMDTVYTSVDIRNLDESNHVYTLKQSLILTWACRLNHKACVNISLEKFEEYKLLKEKPDKNIRGFVFCTALRYTDKPEDWDLVWDAYRESDVANEKSILLSALGCTQNETQLEAFLQMTLNSGSGFRSQDVSSVFSAVYGDSEVGINVAFKFLRENYEIIEVVYNSMKTLSNIISGIAERFTTQEQLQLLRDFTDFANISDSFRQSSENAYSTAVANLAWINQNQKYLEEYYANTSPNTTTTIPSPTSTTERNSAVAITMSMWLMVLFMGIHNVLS